MSSGYNTPDNHHKDIYLSIVNFLNDLTTPNISPSIPRVWSPMANHGQPLHHSRSARTPHAAPTVTAAHISCNWQTMQHESMRRTPIPSTIPVTSSTQRSCYDATAHSPQNGQVPATLTGTTSLTVPEFIHYMQVLNNFESWDTLRWRAHTQHECLQLLSEAFQNAKGIANRVGVAIISNLTNTPLPQGEKKVTGEEILEVMETQRTIVGGVMAIPQDTPTLLRPPTPMTHKARCPMTQILQALESGQPDLVAQLPLPPLIPLRQPQHVALKSHLSAYLLPNL
ncbi:hypothetical protein J3A83DRAFT_4369032 [Scleroderma citrinum]